jgi:hypothetical protein
MIAGDAKFLSENVRIGFGPDHLVALESGKMRYQYLPAYLNTVAPACVQGKLPINKTYRYRSQKSTVRQELYVWVD